MTALLVMYLSFGVVVAGAMTLRGLIFGVRIREEDRFWRAAEYAVDAFIFLGIVLTWPLFAIANHLDRRSLRGTKEPS